MVALVVDQDDVPDDVWKWADGDECEFVTVLASDFTGDAVPDAVWRGNNGTSHGFYFVVDGATYRVILPSRYFTGGGYEVKDGLLVERAPTLLSGDAFSAPTGPVVLTTFRWDAAAAALVPATRRTERTPPSAAPDTLPGVSFPPQDYTLQRVVKPRAFSFGSSACSVHVDGVRWQWGSTRAVGVGRANFPVFREGVQCAEANARAKWKRVRITLTRPRACKGTVLFTRIGVSSPGHRFAVTANCRLS